VSRSTEFTEPGENTIPVKRNALYTRPRFFVVPISPPEAL